MPGRRHLSFYHCPMRGRRGFAELDCMHVTLHFESPDPFNSDHQNPIGASCHRGSISPSGSSRNSSLEQPGTIFVLSGSLSNCVGYVYVALKVVHESLQSPSGSTWELRSVTEPKFDKTSHFI